MDIHKNARLTPHSRGELVRRILVEGQTPKAVATAFGVCSKTVDKWVERFQIEGEIGLQDRSSRPHRLRCPTPKESGLDLTEGDARGIIDADMNELPAWSFTAAASMALAFTIAGDAMSDLLSRCEISQLPRLVIETSRVQCPTCSDRHAQ